MDAKLTLVCLFLGYITICLGQHQVSVLPPRCAAISCLSVTCKNAVTPPGECCPRCPEVPNCAAVFCPSIPRDCNSFTPKGECCPRCGQDCSVVRCAMPKPGCDTIPPGGCCPVCPRRQCLHLGTKIDDGQTVNVDCNTCTCNDGTLACTEKACPTCADAICPKLPQNCFKPYTPKGECCPKCGQDCRVVRCGMPKPTCDFIPPGGCCPICKPRNKCWHSDTLIDNGATVSVQCNTCTCIDGNLICTEKLCGCYDNGRFIPEGGSVKVDCNTCSCSNGKLLCTLIACVIDKPGTCPRRVNPIGHCAEICSTDSECPGRKKCCSTGCGRDCFDPVEVPGRQCWHRGTKIEDGQTVNDGCNTCTCNDGNLACTEKACGCYDNGRFIPEGGSVKVDCNTCSCSNGNLICTLMACDKPGTCPRRVNPIGHCAEICSTDSECPGRKKCCSTGCGRDCFDPVEVPVVKPGTCPRRRIGHCALSCTTDNDCDGRQKCCSNGCGRDCMNPIGRPNDCSNVTCQPIPDDCPRIINRPGRCCPICRRRRRNNGRPRTQY